jgi:hypothetical protein
MKVYSQAEAPLVRSRTPVGLVWRPQALPRDTLSNWIRAKALASERAAAAGKMEALIRHNVRSPDGFQVAVKASILSSDPHASTRCHVEAAQLRCG